MDLLAGAGAHAGGYGKRRAWGINALRETTRLPRHAVLKAARPFGFPGGTRVTLRIAQEDGSIGQGVGRFRLAATTAADPLIGAKLAPPLRLALTRPAAERTVGGDADLAAEFRRSTPLLAPTRDALKAARKALVDLQLPSTLVMQDRPGFERPSYELRERGAFTSRGERMYARTPLALPPMKDSLPANRLGLARWLVDRDNPLVARVHGQPPVGAALRPRPGRDQRGLRDAGPAAVAPRAARLARRRADGSRLEPEGAAADDRHLGDLSSGVGGVTPALAERDPYNRLFARGPRFRLEAEMIRDGELAASGLLSPKMHGPSVFPAQPDGIWNMPYNEDRVGRERGRGSLPPQPLHVPAPDVAVSDAHDVRRHQPRVLRGAARAHEHAAAGADAAERSRLVRGGAGAGGARRQRAGSAEPGDARLPARRRARSEAGRARAAPRLRRRRARPSSRGARREAAQVAPAPAAGQSAADAAAWTLAANVLLNLDETVTKN